MTGPVVLVTRDQVELFEDERRYYARDPFITLTFDGVWSGVSHRITDRALRVPAALALWRLTADPWADVSDLATHYVAEPGAPLEPIPRSAA